ncbi:MAG: class D sortase [Clostridium sp.]
MDKKKWIALPIFIIGIVICLGAIIPYTISQYQSRKLIKELENYNETEIVEDNFEINIGESIEDENGSNVDVNNPRAIAILQIDTIKLKLPVLEGATYENLNHGVGHYERTAKPGGKGNCVLAGHNYGRCPTFKNLHKLSIGDEVKLIYKGNTYLYIVNEKSVIYPDDVEVLDDREGINELTLITCTNEGKQRLITKCILQ